MEFKYWKIVQGIFPTGSRLIRCALSSACQGRGDPDQVIDIGELRRPAGDSLTGKLQEWISGR